MGRFKLQGTKHLVDFLPSINYDTHCKLRQISVRGYSFPVYPNSYPLTAFEAVRAINPEGYPSEGPLNGHGGRSHGPYLTPLTQS